MEASIGETILSWAKLDDNFDENSKQLRMSDAAFRVWVCSFTYCARQRPVTGFMTEAQAMALVRKLGKTRRIIKELLELSGWESVEGGYVIHDYNQYLDRGSQERTERWRSRKGPSGTEGRPGSDVTVTSRARHGDEKKSHGDVTVTSARDPVPEPIPGPGYPPPHTPPPEGGQWGKPVETSGVAENPAGVLQSPGPSLSPAAIELLQGYQELGYVQPSATDQIKAEEFVTELGCLTAGEMLQRMREHLAWCQEHSKGKPRSLGGFWKTLRAENDRRRDLGIKPKALQARMPGTGMTRLGDVLPAKSQA